MGITFSFHFEIHNARKKERKSKKIFFRSFFFLFLFPNGIKLEKSGVSYRAFSNQKFSAIHFLVDITRGEWKGRLEVGLRRVVVRGYRPFFTAHSRVISIAA